MLKRGTFCYVVPSCVASPAARNAVGKIVEIVGGPFHRAAAGLRIASYNVHYRGLVFYCHAGKLRPINDPDADVGEPQDGSLAR